MPSGIFNATPFQALAPPLRDARGRAVATLVVKATFELSRAGRARLADEQAPIRVNDLPHDPSQPAGSIRYPTDLAPMKVGADVIVLGDAVSPRPVPAIDVAVRVRDRTAPLRAHGPRVYFASLGRVAVGPAAKVERVSIVYEKAYGGATPDLQRVERRNPIGVGVAHRAADLDGKPAPQIEHPERPITAAGDAPEPAGYGAIASHWSPRAEHVGTIDEAWRTSRMPLLPLDFDARFHNVAPPALRLDEPLLPGDEIAIVGMTLEPLFRIEIPALSVRVRAVRATGLVEEVRPAIDTLLVEPGQGRFEVTARASFPVGRGPTLLREIRVDQHASS
jgi:hypothetical protein